MEEKIQHSKFTLCAIKGIQELDNCLDHCTIERSLLELVKLRASQIYDCEQCREMHTREARTTGYTLQRLFALKNWRESDEFNDREKAALAWTEAITSSSRQAAVDILHDDIRKILDEQELVAITMAVTTVDSWSRLSLTVRSFEDLADVGR
ncbi:carboxymuconolactone decarboxylase family protein [Salinimicrobium sediminilitoris]|uniref:carboxymuconolactone decarboxylase family protein n=1 Tax=Salinimicrobium sediminilitoris TaxID=2876715 RepID=UPI001E39B53C|nr:carboxymuconolactone decarboxylase family protein [Salinimicrobium sediminilitoris]MCC8358333.1 carboxymuconolactone decarboxylase family protein [Salinimicrobium sediminilitoris]